MRAPHRGFGGRNRSGRRARGWIVKAGGVEGGGGKLGKLIDQMDGFYYGKAEGGAGGERKGEERYERKGGGDRKRGKIFFSFLSCLSLYPFFLPTDVA